MKELRELRDAIELSWCELDKNEIKDIVSVCDIDSSDDETTGRKQPFSIKADVHHTMDWQPPDYSSQNDDALNFENSFENPCANSTILKQQHSSVIGCDEIEIKSKGDDKNEWSFINVGEESKVSR